MKRDMIFILDEPFVLTLDAEGKHFRIIFRSMDIVYLDETFTTYEGALAAYLKIQDDPIAYL